MVFNEAGCTKFVMLAVCCLTYQMYYFISYSQAKLVPEANSSAAFLSRVLQYLETPQYVCVAQGVAKLCVCVGRCVGGW